MTSSHRACWGRGLKRRLLPSSFIVKPMVLGLHKEAGSQFQVMNLYCPPETFKIMYLNNDKK